MTYSPTSDVVAIAWLRSALNTTLVDTHLPTDNNSWGASGFAVVQGIHDQLNSHNSMHSSLMQVDCYSAATAPNTSTPYWVAGDLGKRIINLSLPKLGGTLFPCVLPAMYSPAGVLEIEVRWGPRLMPVTPTGFAKYTLEFQMFWADL